MIRLLARATDDRSRQGFFLHFGGKKKNRKCWPAVVGREKNKKGKIDRFSLKMANKIKAEMATFFMSDIFLAHWRACHPKNIMQAA